jgi:uncharacterized Zn-binding protein involved in type VI secretion
MSRRFVLKGDKTEHDGVVLDGIAGSSLDGRPLAYLGAPVFCYTVQHGRRQLRRWLASHDPIMGKQVALENDLCQCKCDPLPKLVASQTEGTVSI